MRRHRRIPALSLPVSTARGTLIRNHGDRDLSRHHGLRRSRHLLGDGHLDLLPCTVDVCTSTSVVCCVTVERSVAVTGTKTETARTTTETEDSHPSTETVRACACWVTVRSCVTVSPCFTVARSVAVTGAVTVTSPSIVTARVICTRR